MRIRTSLLPSRSLIQIQPVLLGALPRATKNEIRAACDWTKASQSEQCEKLLDQMHETIGHIDLYNVYGPCISGSRPTADQDNADAGHTKAAQTQAGTLAQATGARLGSAGPDACIDSITASEYFNRDEVQAAIHVKKPPERWATCGSAPGWGYERSRKNLPRDTCAFRIVLPGRIRLSPCQFANYHHI